MSEHNLLIVLGATAVGKTALAVQLAKSFNGEVISADSRQVFRGMDIGTGKDLSEYSINGIKIPYHLIDIRNAGEHYHVNSFKEDFYQAFEDISNRARLPILCGGTGMYIHSLLQNHDLTSIPVNADLRQHLLVLDKIQLQHKLDTYSLELRKKVDYSSSKRLIRAIEIADFLSKNDYQPEERPVINPFLIGLYNEVETRRSKILSRLDARLSNGLIEEVERLLAAGVSKEMLVFYGLEYKFIVAYLNKEIDFDMLKERLGIAICQFAKRQMTFFRKMEKDGVKIQWLLAGEDKQALKEEAIDLVRKNF